MSAEEILFKIKNEYNKCMFDSDWIVESYKQIFENSNQNIQNELLKYISMKQETEIQSIKALYKVFNKETQEEETKKIKETEKAKFKLLENKHPSYVISLPPTNDSQNEATYNDILEQKLKLKFKEFDEVSSIYGIINQACKMYDEEDNLTRLTSLLNKGIKIQNLIFKKKNKEYLDRALFEDEIIKYYNKEMLEVDEYTEIIKYPSVKCLYTEVSIKLKVTNEIKNCSMQKLFQMLNNKDSLKNWFPFINESKTIVNFSESKSIYYTRSLIPIIQDRELYLYGFVDNQLLENGKVLFYCRSADNLTNQMPEDIFAGMFKATQIDEIQRMYAHCIVFEVNVISPNKATIDLFVDINHELKFVSIVLVEVISKQICKMFSDKITEICGNDNKLNKYIPSLPTEFQKNYAIFYEDLINKYYNKISNGVFENAHVDDAKKEGYENNVKSNKIEMGSEKLKVEEDEKNVKGKEEKNINVENKVLISKRSEINNNLHVIKDCDISVRSKSSKTSKK